MQWQRLGGKPVCEANLPDPPFLYIVCLQGFTVSLQWLYLDLELSKFLGSDRNSIITPL